MIHLAFLRYIGEPQISYSFTGPCLEVLTLLGTDALDLQPLHRNSQRHTCFAPLVFTDLADHQSVALHFVDDNIGVKNA